MIKIVIAEDQQMLLGAFGSLLNLEDDMEVVGKASNGEEAVTLVKKFQPDVCIMDIEMPVMDGLSATKYIRSQICRSTHIIALTENEEAGEQEVLLKEGVNDVLLKPFQEGELLKLMIKWFNNKK